MEITTMEHGKHPVENDVDNSKWMGALLVSESNEDDV